MRLRNHVGVVACVAVAAATSVTSSARQAPGRSAPVVAAGSVSFADPAGDVQPIIYLESVGDGPQKEVKYPGFDVIKVDIASDGNALTFAATLKTPPAQASYEVLEFYVDADNNAKTGITHPDAPARLTGVEYYGTLENCIEHEFFGTMCAGAEKMPKSHSAIVTLEKFGNEWMNKDVLVSLPASGTVKPAKAVPVKGAVVQASVDYAAMGVRPGQTIRLVIREACAGKVAGVTQGFFSDVLLTLK